MDDGTKRERFSRIDEKTMWSAGGGIMSDSQFSPFDEITNSSAPYCIVDIPHKYWEDSGGVTYVSSLPRGRPGQHVLINDDVLALVRLWQKNPNFGGIESLRQFLDACYA